MKIEINLYASLARYLPSGFPGKGLEMNIPVGTKVGEVLEMLKVPDEEVKMIFLNGLHAKSDKVLKDGDRLGVFPPVAGG